MTSWIWINKFISIFLFYIILALAQGIRKSDWFNNNPGHMPLCLFMLLPLSGRCAGSLAKEDQDVEEVGEIEIKINNRPYNPKVFKVSERDKNGQNVVNVSILWQEQNGKITTQNDDMSC